MPPIRRAAVTGLFALWLAPLPALAGSQSSNSSSNCSNGHCSRADRLVIEDRDGRRGFTGTEQWQEGRGGRWRHEERFVLPRGEAARRGRDDDDDDEED